MNAHGNPQDGTARSATHTCEMIGKLQAVEQQLTPRHVASRFRQLLDGIDDDSPDGDTPAPAPTPVVNLQSFPGALAASGGFFGDPGTAGLAGAWSAQTGYRPSTTAAAAGVTTGQLSYWARTGLVEPSVAAAQGPGSHRLYSFRDVLVLKVVKRLLDTGISLQQIRAAVEHLRDHATENLAQVTLMSNGVSVYEYTSPDQADHADQADQAADLPAGGQGFFGIALGGVWQEVAQQLGGQPAAPALDSLVVTGSPAAAAATAAGDRPQSFLRPSG